VPEDELTAGPPGADHEEPAPTAADVLDALRGGEVEVLGRMPWSSNTTLLVAVRGEVELHAVYKPRRGERPLWDFPAGLDARETAAYELSAWLGWGIVPETVLRTTELPFGQGSLQRFVPFDADQHYFTLVEEEGRLPALRTICAFDLVANSADRKGGHCLAGDDGATYAVDNGLTFHEELKLRTVIWEFGGEAVPDALLDDLGRLARADPLPQLCELLSPAEVRAMTRRAEALVTSRTYPVDRTGRRYPWPLV
jgi:uncharacterized repeat protein (TIGR03843 family)